MLWLGVMSIAGTFTSCYGHNCDGSSVRYGINPGEGDLLTPNTWESNPGQGDFLPYPRQRTIFFEAPFGDGVFATVLSYISADQNPVSVGGNDTLASGNVVETTNFPSGAFAVHNDTCADYFIRVVAFTGAPPGAPTVKDAGTD